MATVSFSLLRPYKKSTSEDKEIAKIENDRYKAELRKRRKEGKSIDSLLVSDLVRIYLHLTISKTEIVTAKTDEKIQPKKWDFSKGRAKSSYPGSPDLNRILDNLRKDVEDCYRKLKLSQPDVTFAEVDKVIKDLVAGKKPKTNDNSFFGILAQFKEVKAATQKERTLKRYNSLETALRDFEEKEGVPLSFDKIDLNFYDRFKNYLLTKPNPKKNGIPGLVDDTIAKYIADVKYFLKWSFERGFHKNLIFRHGDFKASRKPKQDIVTLTDAELHQLHDFDLSRNPRLERVRDVFLFAVYTGQRWSDVARFDKSQLKGNVWSFEVEKGKEPHRVPLIGFAKPALDILKKYDYELPVISSQRFNDYIKEAGKLAGLDDQVTIVRYSGKRTIPIVKPKWEFMSTHMARRTAVTLLLEAGVPPTTVMKLTLHKDLKTIMKYENTGEHALIRELERVGKEREKQANDQKTLSMY